MDPVSYNTPGGQAYEGHPSGAGQQVVGSYAYLYQPPPPPTAAVLYDARPPPPVYTREALPHAAAASPVPPAGGYISDHGQLVAPPPYGQAPHYVAQPSAPLEYNIGCGVLTRPTPSPYGQSVYYQQPQLSANVTVASSPTVVITQPSTVILQVNSYLGWSIFNFLCCCWPLGLAAIIYSVKVSSARTSGESKRYSLTARNINIAATVIAPVLVCIIVPSVYLAPGAIGKSKYLYFESTRSSSRLQSYSYYTNAIYYSDFLGYSKYRAEQKTGYRYVVSYEYFVDSTPTYS